jgi:hypothetical protein
VCLVHLRLCTHSPTILIRVYTHTHTRARAYTLVTCGRYEDAMTQLHEHERQLEETELAKGAIEDHSQALSNELEEIRHEADAAKSREEKVQSELRASCANVERLSSAYVALCCATRRPLTLPSKAPALSGNLTPTARGLQICHDRRRAGQGQRWTRSIAAATRHAQGQSGVRKGHVDQCGGQG